MSRTSDINFSFGSPAMVRSVIEALQGAGWSMEEPLGVSYMVDIDDEFEWKTGNVAQSDDILSLLDSPENRDRHVGICVYHVAADTGGQLLFHAGHLTCSFIPTIDRRGLPGAEDFTDISWYLHALIPPLLSVDLLGYEACDLAN